MNLKEKCHILRSQGKSYNTIVRETGVSKSTLSFWFAGTLPAQTLISGNPRVSKAAAKEHLLAYHAKRKQDLKQKEFAALLQAQKDFEKHHKHPLFVAGLMLYVNSGDQGHRHLIKLSHSNPALCRIFMRFIDAYFPLVDMRKVKLGILAYEDHSLPLIEGYWQKMLGLSPASFNKTQVIRGRKKTNKLPYGIGNASISNRLAKIRLLEFIRLSIKVLSQS